MKLIVVALFTLLGLAVADGVRGAAERALIFATYVLEEVHDFNSYTPKIAPGCIGTRQGLRSQTNRCTLKELCEHLWMQSSWTERVRNAAGAWVDVDRSDTEPDKTKTVWQAAAQNGAAGLDKLDAKKMKEAIMAVGMKELTSEGKEVNGKLAKKGYYGNLNIAHVLDGATDYFAVMREFGRNAYLFKQDYEGIKTSFTKAMQTRIETWYKHSTTAADMVVDLRLKDKYDIEKAAVLNGLRDLFPTDADKRNAVKITMKEAPKLTDVVPKMMQVDIETTAKNLAGPLDMTEDAIKTKMNDILVTGAATEVGMNHEAAIHGAQRSASLAKTGTCS